MSRRSVTLLVAAAGVLIAIVVAVIAPVPYVALTPGPTLNTLGILNGKPLIQVKGHRTYPTRGNLNMVTVSFLGGPQTDFNIFAALRAWLSPHDAVVPEQEIFTPGQSPAAGGPAGHRGDGGLAADGDRCRALPAQHQLQDGRDRPGNGQGNAGRGRAAPGRRHRGRRRHAAKLPRRCRDPDPGPQAREPRCS